MQDTSGGQRRLRALPLTKRVRDSKCQVFFLVFMKVRVGGRTFQYTRTAMLKNKHGQGLREIRTLKVNLELLGVSR